MIGGVPGNFGLSARLGNSDFFVVEADEYDTAFFDKRSKFVHYRPRTLCLINLEFDVGTDLQQAMLDVLNALNNADPLPVDADEPQIQVGGWSFPVATLLVHPIDPVPGTDVTDFQRIIDTEVEPRLLAIDGVQRVNLQSEREEMVLVTFDPYRTAALGISVSQISDAISRAVNTTGGLASVGRWETDPEVDNLRDRAPASPRT